MKQKKILITGGTGFVGSNLTRKLVSLGFSPTLFIRKSSNLWRIKDILSKIKVEEINLNDKEKLEKSISKLKPDFIYHTAAHGANQGSNQNLESSVQTNILATANLIESCCKVGFSYFINTGSSSEYGIKDLPMKESDLLEPANIYGITKASATSLCNYFSNLYKLPTVTLRLFSPYGYFEDKNRLIPTIILGALNGSSLNLSNPNSVRDFIFIEDVIDSYLYFLVGKKFYGEVFNIGSGRQHRIGDVVNTVALLINDKINVEWYTKQPKQKEPKKWEANIDKAEKRLNWTPKNNLQNGLEKNIEWLRKNLNTYGK